MPDNPHAGHRERLREKYRKGGIEYLSFHEILELILFQSIPRRDTNKIAHELAEKFKDASGKYSLANILQAGEQKLKEVRGISDHAVFSFKLLTDITRLYNLEIANSPVEITDKSVHEKHLIAHFTGKQKEEVVLLTLNNRQELISSDVIYVGGVNSVKVDMRKMVGVAIGNNASSVIMAHNHPNGPDYPSPEDIETTRRIERLFNEISIRFIDHYVVANTKISSIRDQTVYGYVNLTK